MKRLCSLLLAVLMVLGLMACGTPAPAADTTKDAAPSTTTSGLPALTKETIKVGFVYGSAIGKEGYTYAHDLGRLALEAQGIQTMYVESVLESEACEKTIRDLIAQGCNVIYAISFGHGEYVSNVAEEYPDVYFNHATGYITKENMATYMGRMYQVQYLAGIAAAMKTKSNQIGFVTTFPLPECVRQVNSFTLGALSVNPDVEVSVKWTSAWFDPATEKAAATELLNGGCDVIAAYCDTMNPQMTAAEKGCYAIGCSSSGHDVIPDNYLTAPLFDWGAFYTADVARILDGSWVGAGQWLGLNEGVVALDKLTNCAEGTDKAVETAKAAIMDGSLDMWAGELKDNEGTVRVKTGETLDDAALQAMDWFVAGVKGTVG